MEIDCQSLEGLFFKNFSLEQRDNQHWGQFRFSVIGELLSSPPAKGQLLQAIQRLSQKIYQHPIDEDQRFTVGASTIERWYYKAKEVDDPVFRGENLDPMPGYAGPCPKHCWML